MTPGRLGWRARGGRVLSWQPHIRSAEAAFTAAKLGLLMVVPSYRCATGHDGTLMAVPVEPAVCGELERAAIAGDVARRYWSGVLANDGVDPFADVRHGAWLGRWPHERQQPMYVCGGCGAISASPGDVQHTYCGRCHKTFDEVPEPIRMGVWSGDTMPSVRFGGSDEDWTGRL